MEEDPERMGKLMKDKKKTPAIRADVPGKRRKTKILFYDFIRIPGKRQVRTLSWGERYVV